MLLSQDIEKEIGHMCNLGEGIKEEGLRALIETLRDLLPTFDDVYAAVTKNDIYKDVTEEQVKKYY